MPRKNKAKPVPPEYCPTPVEREVFVKSYEDRKYGAYPKLKVVNGRVVIDHPDAEFGMLLMKSALGSWDSGFIVGLLAQLGRCAVCEGQINVVNLNFLLAYIVDGKPRNQTEAMLAAQMAMVHFWTMTLTSNLSEIDLAQLEIYERTINEFMRTFTMQMEALNRHRFGGEQKITVQHVSVSEGGQAILGNITQHPRGGALDPTPLALADSKARPMKVVGKPAALIPIKRKSGK